MCTVPSRYLAAATSTTSGLCFPQSRIEFIMIGTLLKGLQTNIKCEMPDSQRYNGTKSLFKWRAPWKYDYSPFKSKICVFKYLIVYIVPGASEEDRGEIRDSEFRGDGIDLENKSSIYLLLVCFSVCLFIWYPINVKKAEPIRPKFCVTRPQGRFMNDQ